MAPPFDKDGNMAWRIADNVVRGEIDNQTPGLV
jgi:hypothetical protein